MGARFFLWLAVAGGLSAVASDLFGQITAGVAPVADAYVRSASPTSNFGSAGALSVSGLIATNGSGVQQGAFDSFLRFDISGIAATFNTSFGSGNWTVTNATLSLTEVGAPNNSSFNRGIGQFQVQWLTNDVWAESGITWNTESNFLNSSQVTLGTFSNHGTDGLVTLSLGLPTSFLNDLLAGGLVSFYMPATSNSTVGFTFNSRDFTSPSARPSLSLTATAVPEPSTLCLLTVAVAVLLSVRLRRSR